MTEAQQELCLPLAKVIRPGPQSTIQDLGRKNFLSEGVPQSGAMDPFALRSGNRVLGNPDDTAGLEITFSRLELSFINVLPKNLVITGARCTALLNETPVGLYEPVAVQKGDYLTLQPLPANGARTYLCLDHGIAATRILESQSTYLPGKFGGYAGRALQAQDVISVLSQRRKHSFRADPKQFKDFLAHSNPREIHYLPHPVLIHGKRLLVLSKNESRWQIEPQSNRIGIRLIPLESGLRARILEVSRQADELISQGTFPGVIQLPPDGRPVILGADAPTIGGYPILGCIIQGDLWKLGQLIPGKEIQLVPTTLARARRISSRAELLISRRSRTFDRSMDG